nr:MAG TPA: hypothetical protein [Caudoviricetes sp.]
MYSIFIAREENIPFYRERYNMDFVNKGFKIASLYIFIERGSS